MRTARAVLVALLVLATVVAFGAGGSSAAPFSASAPSALSSPISTATDDTTDGSTSGSNATNASLGAHLSSFMQSNAARTTDAVETGMWSSSYANATSNASRAALVRRRTDGIERRIERLRARKAALDAARRNGTVPEVAYRARMSRIAGRLAALSEAIDETHRRATAIGVNATELTELRGRARRIADDDVRSIARGLDGRSPDRPDWVGVERGEESESGPPEGVPAGGNGSDGTGPPDNPTGAGGGDNTAGGNDTAGGNGGGPGGDNAGENDAGRGGGNGDGNAGGGKGEDN